MDRSGNQRHSRVVELRGHIIDSLMLPRIMDELMGLGAFRNKFVHELSTGSRRIVDLACVLAHQPTVLLLDEPSSGIAQREAEALGPLLLRIRDALKTLMKGRTTIAIAHRLSTIQDMDRVLVFHKGELRESGPHRQLIAERGIYRRLYELQFAGGAD